MIVAPTGLPFSVRPATADSGSDAVTSSEAGDALSTLPSAGVEATIDGAGSLGAGVAGGAAGGAGGTTAGAGGTTCTVIAAVGAEFPALSVTRARRL